MRQDNSPRRRRRILGARVAFATVAALAFAGMAAVAPAASPANAADATSSLTVKWTGDGSSAKDYQPARNTASPHYSDFKDLVVTVSQTSQIIDQAVRVEVSGFHAGTKSELFGASNAQNFMQAMQCWGADPLAADFVHTCQWGGAIPPIPNSSVYYDNLQRVAPKDSTPQPPVTPVDNKFTTVTGNEVSAKYSFDAKGNAVYPIFQYFGQTTTNEVVSARVGADGKGYFDFETQSSSQSPQLGCGTPGHLRCWLVIVPRGTKFGGDGSDCSDYVDRNGDYLTYGRSNSTQAGSPVNPKCDYFDNRIVVPLDFTPTRATCQVGSTEFRVSGSQFMISAMSSWQPSLCQTMSSTFSFATNPDSVARQQLLQTRAGSPELIYSGYAVSSDELPTVDERTQLTKTALQYAPVAVSSVVIAYNAEFANGRPQGLIITPRLMAKILTQSYRFTIPPPGILAESIAHLSVAAQGYTYFNMDKDFQQANPANWQEFNQANPSIVLPGPGAADGIRQVWRWILADKDAVDFLDGKADPWGMTVNPYYLPALDPHAVVPWYLDSDNKYISTPVLRQVGEISTDGTPLKLSSAPLDVFPKDDGSLQPTKLSVETSRYDSIQFAPFAPDYLGAARQVFRADPNSKTLFDTTKPTDIGFGAWVSVGTQKPGDKFIIAVTDSANAARYGLSTASIKPANSTNAVQSTAATMAAALTSLTPTSLDKILQVDPSKVAGDAYPLTMVTYAGVNLTKSTAASRQTISKMIQQVTTAGQIPGPALGELPVGYVPLTADLRDQAAAAASAIQTWTPPSSTGTSNNNTNNSSVPQAYSAEDGLVDPTAQQGADPTTITSGADQATNERTLSSTSGPLNAAPAIALIVGLLGFLIAPFILRGRGLL